MKHINLEDIPKLKTYLKDPLNESTENYCVELILRLGLRGIELMNLTLDDFDFINNEVQVKGAKGGDSLVIGISKGFMQRFQSYLSKGHYDQHKPIVAQLWPNPSKVNSILGELRLHLKTILFRLFGERYRRLALHSLRHSFALGLLAKGLGINEVRLAVRHKNIQNTLIYTDYGAKLDLKTKIKRAVGS
jgi:integrase